MIRNNRSLLARCVAAAAAGLGAVPFAIAQAPAGNSFVIEEIVVTAQKRQESAQDVPIAISTITEDFMLDASIFQITDLLKYTPGLSGNTAGSGSPIWAVRGISTNDFTTGSEPSVGTYQDDAYIGRNFYANAAYFDVDRVEVVRGPQGTLFGRNTVAGAINVISNKPEDTSYATVALGVGNEDQRSYDVIGNLAASDDLAFRLAYRHMEYDGIAENTFDGSNLNWEEDGVRLGVRWDVSDSFTALLMAQHYEVRDNVNNLHFPDLATVGGGDAYPDKYSHETRDFERNDVNGYDLRLTWALSDSLQLTSITDYRDFDFAIGNDLDSDFDLGFGGSIGFVLPDINGDSMSQELRLNGSSERLDWFVGASWYSEDTSEFQSITIGDFTTDEVHAKGEITSYGVYGDAVWHASDDLNLTAGVRYTRDDKDWCSLNVGVIGTVPDSGGESICGNESWTEVTPRLVADYAINDELMVYASYSVGYKAGGFNTFLEGTVDPDTGAYVATGNLLSFDPENLAAYEIGLKSTLLDGSLQFNAAAYFNDYEDLQVQILGFQIFIDNAAKAETQGLELEATWLPPVQGLSVSANYAYNDTEYTEGDLQGTNIEGNQLIQAPEHSAAASLKYDIPLTDLGTLSFFAGYSWQSEQYFDAYNTDYLSEDSFGLADASISFEHSSGRWGVALSAKNLLDEEYPVLLADGLGFGVPGVIRGMPRFVLATVNVRFGD